MCRPGDSSQSTLALWKTYRVQLVALNRLLNAKEDGTPPIDPKIDELLGEADKGEDWNRLYEAEQRLVALMPDEMVGAEAARRFTEAEKLALKSGPPLKKAFEAASELPDDKLAERHAGRRAALRTLLGDLHYGFTKRGLDRMARKKGATRVNACGVVVLVLSLVVLLGIVFAGQFNFFVWYHPELKIVAAMTFGMVGAYLSRVLSFQTALTGIDYDSIEQDFTFWSIGVKLITGALGALVMYLLISAKLLSGELFPQEQFMTSLGSASDVHAYWSTVDFAKLLVWSILAGFSERLIPDQFTRLEAATRDSAQPGK